MAQTSPHSAVLIELEPVVAQNLDRHLALAREWHPHDYIPWSEGRDFAFLGGEDWSPEQSRLDETAKAAMITNLLTEDNLPSYHREIATRFGHDGTPLRAVCSVSLEEAGGSVPRQNPTSGGDGPVDTHLVVAGDSLAGVAWQTYGDPGRWREIARANGIDRRSAVDAYHKELE